MFVSRASRPPMGWNSWDCFGFTVTEEELRATARVMAEKLLPHGWEYVVIDAMWYDDQAVKTDAIPDPESANLNIDEWGRFVPSPVRFPSSAGGKGFKPLADYVHSLGLKLGIHQMRGIPRRAVTQGCGVLGTELRASDVALREAERLCPWNHDCWALDPQNPAARAYYQSVLDLFASWEIDYLKYDDLSSPSRPERLACGDIEAIREALEKTGRDMVLSLSPGAGVGPEDAEFLQSRAELWRVTGDLWDDWEDVVPKFEVLADWAPHGGGGHWPDPDMLPLGRIAIRTFRAGDERQTRLTPDEQRTMMSLWCIARAPLMFGGDLRQLDDFTLSLLKNDSVLAAQRSGGHPRQLRRDGELVQWVSEAGEELGGLYVACFNLGDADGAAQSVDLGSLGFGEKSLARELWTEETYRLQGGRLECGVPAHGCRLYHVCGA